MNIYLAGKGVLRTVSISEENTSSCACLRKKCRGYKDEVSNGTDLIRRDLDIYLGRAAERRRSARIDVQGQMSDRMC